MRNDAGAVRRLARVVAGAVLLIGAAPHASAQVRPVVAPLVTPGCAEFDLNFPSDDKPSKDPQLLSKIQGCLESLHLQLDDTALAAVTPADQDGKPTDLAVHNRIVGAYLSYTRLRRWRVYSRTLWTHADLAPMEDAFNRLSQTLHERLTEHELLRSFSAELVTGFSFTALGAQTASAPTSVDVSQLDSQSAQVTGFVSWETLHFFSATQRGPRPDVSVFGTIGFRPTLTLVDIPDTNHAGATIGPFGTFQQAFAWDSGVKINWKLGDLTEHGPFVRYGQTILTSIDTLLGNAGQSVIGTQARNVTGRAEGKLDVGYKVNLFDDSLDLVHIDKSSLNPMFFGAFGVKHDSRFKGQGVLASFDDPEWRLFYTIAVDALNIVKPGSKDKPFSLMVQVDYETALKQPASGYVPSATRVFIQGTTDLIKVFQGNGK
jgi:hypothetical protein